LLSVPRQRPFNTLQLERQNPRVPGVARRVGPIVVQHQSPSVAATLRKQARKALAARLSSIDQKKW
jgi:predicted site-specific integrase-resolvase